MYHENTHTHIIVAGLEITSPRDFPWKPKEGNARRSIRMAGTVMTCLRGPHHIGTRGVDEENHRGDRTEMTCPRGPTLEVQRLIMEKHHDDIVGRYRGIG